MVPSMKSHRGLLRILASPSRRPLTLRCMRTVDKVPLSNLDWDCRGGSGVVVVVVFELVTLKVGETPVLLFRSYVNYIFVTIF